MTMPKPNTSAHSTRFACLPWPEIGLLALYVNIRAHNLTVLPVFVDEVYYITWARLLLRGDYYGVAMSIFHAKPLMPWVLALLGPLTNGLWLSRIIVSLIGALGLAALMTLGHLLLGRGFSLIGGVIYTLLPLTFFFERLAMSDPLAASLGLVASWLIVVALRCHRRRYATLAGVVLALAVFAKLPMLIYLLVPLMAWLWLVRVRREAIPILVWIYIITLALIAAPVIGLARFTDFGLSFVRSYNYTSLDLATLTTRVWGNVQGFAGWMAIYLGWPVLVLGTAGIGGAVLKREKGALFLAALTCLPLLEFWLLGHILFPRFYILSAGGWVLLAAWVIWQGTRWLRIAARFSRILAVLSVVVVLMPMTDFVLVAYADPAALPLAGIDRVEYIQNHYSGYAPRDAALWLKEYVGTAAGITLLCPQPLTCDTLDIYLYGAPGIRFASLDDLSPAWLQAETEAGRIVLFPRESASPAELFAPLREYLVELVHSFPRPLGGETLSLYQVESEK